MPEKLETLTDIFSFPPVRFTGGDSVTLLALIHEASLLAFNSGYSLATVQSFLNTLVENIPVAAHVEFRLNQQFDPLLESMTGDMETRAHFEQQLRLFVSDQRSAGISKTTLKIIVTEYLEVQASKRKGSLANIVYPIVEVANRIIESVYST